MKKFYSLLLLGGLLLLGAQSAWAACYVAHNKVLNSNDWVVNGDQMTEVTTETYFTKEFRSVPANSVVEFKITNGTWDWKMINIYAGQSSDNITVTKTTSEDPSITFTTPAYKSDIVIHFEAGEGKGVYVICTRMKYYLRSSYEDSWASKEMKMTTAAGVTTWSRTWSNVAADDVVRFQFSTSASGWENQLGAAEANAPISIAEEYAGSTSAHQDIILPLIAGNSYTIKYDETNNKYWVESSDAKEIYFYNNMSWDQVYANIYTDPLVFVDDASGQGYIGNQVTNRNIKMIKIGETNYYRCKFKGDCSAVAFISQYQDNYSKFWQTGAVCVDLAGTENLFVANTGTYYDNNDTRYFRKGLWLDYGETGYSRTEGVTNTYFGTICLPFASSAFEGMEVYTVAGLVSGGLGLTPLVGQMAAGTPYVFRATANTISVTYTGNPTADVQAATGLVGNLSGALMDVPEGMYILMANGLRQVSTGGVAKVANLRAYFNLSELSNAPFHPNMRVIAIEESATNITNVENKDMPVKFVENNQLYIRHNGVVYDMTGRIVK